jgi:predicted RNA-binding protein with PUA-like domain
MKYWLLKSEPEKYSIQKFQTDGHTFWDGVRNYQARNNLQAMKTGDLCLYYHSNEGKEIVGMARVIREAYPDPTTEDPAWVVVDVEFVEIFPKTLTLAQLKAHPVLKDMALVKNSRLSVLPVTLLEFDLVVQLTQA